MLVTVNGTSDRDGVAKIMDLTATLPGLYLNGGSALSFFAVSAVGDTAGFTPWGGLVISSRADGSAGSEAQSDAGDWLGGHTFMGYANDDEYSLNVTASHIAAGFWADVAARYQFT